MNEIRIGLIGSGFMGRTNAETVSRYLDGAVLAGVAGGSRAPQLSQQYGTRAYENVDALLADPSIDAVMISTPHATHAAQAVAAAQAGKHILLDKPMAASVDECNQIIDAARQANVRLMIMFGQRFRIVNQEAYRLIREGAIGRVTMIQTYALNTGGLAALPPWQSDPANLGTLFGHGIHNFDLVRWLSGQEIQTVAARIQREAPSNNEVSTMAVLGLTEDVMAHVWVSWSIPLPGLPNTAFGARIVGEKGMLDLDAYAWLKLGRSNGWETIVEQAPIDFKGKGMLDPVRLESYAKQGNEFLSSIREGRAPSVTGEDGRAAVQAALACYDASEQRQTLQLL